MSDIAEYTKEYDSRVLREKQKTVLYRAMDHLLARYDVGEILTQPEIDFLTKHFVGEHNV